MVSDEDTRLSALASGEWRSTLTNASTQHGFHPKGDLSPSLSMLLRHYVGIEHATACCNGTVALHLALLALELDPATK